MKVKTLRAVRWVQVAGFTGCAADLAISTLRLGGSAITFLAAILTVVWLALICAQTLLIRRQVRLESPRPDPVSPPCLHRNAVPVESVLGDAIAKLCPDCDEQLDAGFNPDMVAMVSGYGHCARCGGQLALHATMYRPSVYEGYFYCSPCASTRTR